GVVGGQGPEVVRGRPLHRRAEERGGQNGLPRATLPEDSDVLLSDLGVLGHGANVQLPRTLTVTGPPPAPRLASSTETISRPNGRRPTVISLKFARPRGIPMTVMHKITPVKMCTSVSHQPAITNQMTFPIADPAPLLGLGTTTRPNGHSVNIAIRSDATP